MRTLNINSIQSQFLLIVSAVFAAILLIAGCGGKLQPAFEGSFAHQAKSEFSMASDTLAIEKAGENQYRIHRSTGIRLLNEQGKPGKLILEKEEWKASLDPETGVLTERSKGRTMRVDAQSLTLENAVYRRLP